MSTEEIAQSEEVVIPIDADKDKPANIKPAEVLASVGELFFGALLKMLALLSAVGKKIGSAFAKLGVFFAGILSKVLQKAAGAVIMPIYRHVKAFRIGKNEISKARAEKGTVGGAEAGARVAGRVAFGKRGVAVTIVNWALPIISCVFLFNIISYANSQTYALKLTVNGDFIGYITDETVFTSAEQMVQKRINYTGSDVDAITFEPSYEVDIIGYGKTLNTYQVTDKILGLLYKDISEGFGVYIDDEFYGTIDRHEIVDITLDSMLSEYRTDSDKETVSFDKNISFVSGKYMIDSFVEEQDIINLLTSNKTVASYYTVQENDSPALVCNKVDMTFEELAMLNPGFNKNTFLHTGDKIKVNQEERFLNIVVTREEDYTESLPYDTEYIENANSYSGDEILEVTGKNGEVAVTANVSYINGVEINRQVLSRTVTREPKTEVISIGTKVRDSNAAPPTTVEAGKFRWPVDGGLISEYPWFHGGYSTHKGIDIAAPRGTAIYAAGSGTITKIAALQTGYGYHVVIHHDNGVDVTYAHMCAFSSTIYVGKRVTSGECIGYVGMTGTATGNHLHFEVRKNNIVLDPLDYLPSHATQAGVRFY